MKKTLKEILNSKIERIIYEANLVKTEETDMMIGVLSRLDELKDMIEKLPIHDVTVTELDDLISFCDWYKKTDFNCEGHSSNDCVNEYCKDL